MFLGATAMNESWVHLVNLGATCQQCDEPVQRRERQDRQSSDMDEKVEINKELLHSLYGMAPHP